MMIIASEISYQLKRLDCDLYCKEPVILYFFLPYSFSAHLALYKNLKNFNNMNPNVKHDAAYTADGELGQMSSSISFPIFFSWSILLFNAIKLWKVSRIISQEKQQSSNNENLAFLFIFSPENCRCTDGENVGTRYLFSKSYSKACNIYNNKYFKNYFHKISRRFAQSNQNQASILRVS